MTRRDDYNGVMGTEASPLTHRDDTESLTVTPISALCFAHFADTAEGVEVDEDVEDPEIGF